MKELGCYTDGQRQEIDTCDTWACLACAGQWRKLTEISIRRRMHAVRQSEADLSRPAADSALSKLERQGFEKTDAIKHLEAET
eukprot:67000-Pelagomonas_calceolata.AAC.1